MHIDDVSPNGSPNGTTIPPGMFNIEALNRTILNAANMPNIEQILPPKKEPQQMDPISDIMAATKGIPIKLLRSKS